VRRSIGTIIVFHGNGGTAADRVFYVRELSALGYRVILAEYPRYGGRKGELGEKAFVADANETVRRAFEQFGEPLLLLGESLGCGVAAAVAREASVKVDGIILITPWDTLASVAQSKFPFLPVRLLLTDTYDSIGNLKAFKGRITVVGAERDKIIPIKHANDLYGSLSSATKRMWTIKQAGHNDWPMHTDTLWWKEITDFASGHDEG
jgi:pimeloyl-ACP methyl ester carboxylesterase